MNSRDASSPLALTWPDGRRLALDRPRIMGVLNVTPDSFSDGGQFADPAVAVEQGLRMLEDGAAIVDVGGESTRPGSQAVGVEEQIRRTCPVIGVLVERCQKAGGDRPIISIDTRSPVVAEAALAAGAAMINDVSAAADLGMLCLAARAGVPIVLMHMRGTPATMQQEPQYDDVVAEVAEFLLARARAAIDAGIAAHNVILDPGIGFGKTTAHNLQLLAHLDRLVGSGHPVLLGASRKRFIGAVMEASGATASLAGDRVGGTCAITALGVWAGVRLFRVHDVAVNRQAAELAWAIRGEASSKSQASGTAPQKCEPEIGWHGPDAESSERPTRA